MVMRINVLLVEDDHALREALADTLLLAGHGFRAVCSGEEALAAVMLEPFSLVISDVNMPNMDGITLLKAIKAKPEHRFTPVIMLTTESQEGMKREGQAAGAKAWIVKPFQLELMLAAVEKLLM